MKMERELKQFCVVLSQGSAEQLPLVYGALIPAEDLIFFFASPYLSTLI